VSPETGLRWLLEWLFHVGDAGSGSLLSGWYWNRTTPRDRPASAPAFIAAQLAGGAIGTLLAVIVYPARPSQARAGQPAG